MKISNADPALARCTINGKDLLQLKNETRIANRFNSLLRFVFLSLNESNIYSHFSQVINDYIDMRKIKFELDIYVKTEFLDLKAHILLRQINHQNLIKHPQLIYLRFLWMLLLKLHSHPHPQAEFSFRVKGAIVDREVLLVSQQIPAQLSQMPTIAL